MEKANPSLPERRVSRRSTKGNLPKRYLSDYEMRRRTAAEGPSQRRAETSSGERRAAKAVEKLEAELRAQNEIAQLTEQAIRLRLGVAKKALELESAKAQYRKRSSGWSSSSSDLGDGDEEMFVPKRPTVERATSGGGDHEPVPVSADTNAAGDFAGVRFPASRQTANTSPVESVGGAVGESLPTQVSGTGASLQNSGVPQMLEANHTDVVAVHSSAEETDASSSSSFVLPAWYRAEVRAAGMRAPALSSVSATSSVTRSVDDNPVTVTAARHDRPIVNRDQSSMFAQALSPSHPVDHHTVSNAFAPAPSPRSTCSVAHSFEPVTNTFSASSSTAVTVPPVALNSLSTRAQYERGGSSIIARPSAPRFVASSGHGQPVTTPAPVHRHSVSSSSHCAAPHQHTTVSQGQAPRLFAPPKTWSENVPTFVQSSGNVKRITPRVGFQQSPQTASYGHAPVPSHSEPIPSTMSSFSAGQPFHSGGHLKPLDLPKFNGKDSSYIMWRQKFVNLVDLDPHASEFYKMARLREAVSGGAAEELIADIMDGPGAYQAAVAEIEAWYGGEDRQLERHEKEILSWPKISSERDVEKLKKFALKLRSVLVNMRSCGIAPGRELYLSATQKIPSSLLMKFFERHDDRICDIQLFADWLVDLVHMLRKVEERQSTVHDKSVWQSGSHQQRYKAADRGPQRVLASIADGAGAKAKPAPECKKCGQDHQLFNCRSFKGMSVSDRWSFVKPTNLCTCCLRVAKHRSSECESRACDTCGRKHHNLLHYEKKSTAPNNSKSSSQSQTEAVATPKATAEKQSTSASVNFGSTCLSVEEDYQSHVSFMTVPVTIRNGAQLQEAVALLDPASSISFVREDLTRQLGLKGSIEDLTTSVLGGKTFQAEREKVKLSLVTQSGEQPSELSAFVLPTITAPVKLVDWNSEKRNWPHLCDLEFPDTKGRRHVDLLIGLNAPQLHASLEERKGRPDEPMARLTPLGWVCFGTLSHESSSSMNSTLCSISRMEPQGEQRLDELVRNFWDVEKVGVQETYLTPDERQAEKLVTESLKYEDSHFTVGIPWTAASGNPNLLSNKLQAKQRLQSLERSLSKRPEVQQAYTETMEKYLVKHYIEPVDSAELEQDADKQWYLPHFPVVKNDRATTKVRVVFDASAQWDGKSLNQEMYAGRKTQNDLVHVLLRFCLEPVAMVADISEMFLQIHLNDSDKRFHRFLWRPKSEEEPRVYQFTRVVFGAKASPFLAGRILQETADRFGGRYMAGVRDIIYDNFYVDDLLNSVSDEDTAVRVYSQVKSLLKEGGFNIRKWLSNSEEVMAAIPEADRAPDKSVNVGEHAHCTLPSTKTLGVTWSAATDKFTFVYSDGDLPESLTKRDVLRKMATVFDPRGQITPFTIRSRLLFQQLCIKGYGWDDPIDESDNKKWRQWFAELPSLSSVQAERCFKSTDHKSTDADVQVHTFVDASDCAYAAASYIRCEYPDGSVKVTLAVSKARPAPIRKLSIPKMELKAAVQGVRLGREVEKALGIPVASHTFWTDSMNVLYWVRSHSRKFQTDIGVKISEIHASTSGVQWRHVPGRQNPADLPSRGMTADSLVDSVTWWSGPEYLKLDKEKWPQREIVVPSPLVGETKRSVASVFTVGTPAQEANFRLSPDRFSSWIRLLRVTAWCIRFISCCRKKSTSAIKATSPLSGLFKDITASSHYATVKTAKQQSVQVPELSVEELARSERYWVRVAQQDCYGKAISQLERGESLLNGDSLLSLNPGLDSQAFPAVMSVRGRLDRATQISASSRRPVVLPNKHPVTSLIIGAEDKKCHHEFGPNYVLSNLRQRYWIVRGKQAVKSYCLQCNGCKRKRNKPATQIMGQLPPERVAVTQRPFSNVGVDYAGPFATKQGRGRSQNKRYLCLFTCLETRACHLEMAYDLTLQGFLMCFSRFRKRRGNPQRIVSDNGLNFVGAERELRQSVQQLDASEISTPLAGMDMVWKFNPPGAPHHGGVFESMIKIAKRAIYAVVGNGVCTDEELQTVFVEAEAILNSRPLTSLSEDPGDPEPLTPLHFLVGHNSISHPIESGDEQGGPIHRWRVLQQLVQDMWKRLVKEMLPVLNVRQKWKKNKRDVKVGDVVICVDSHTPRGTWPLGRIVEVHTAEDGKVRVVDVKIRNKVYRRSISVLIPLECEA